MATSSNPGISIEQRLNPSQSRFEQLQDRIMQNLRVAVPAIVQEFFPGPPATVTVLIATNEFVFMNPMGSTIALQTQAQPLPLLTDVPVAFYSAGGWSLTAPINVGDECLLIFSDTPLDVWFQNGASSFAFDANPPNSGNNPINQRRHDLSDATAWFGIRSTPKGLANYSTDSMQLRSDDGTVVIDLADDQITVTAPKVVVNTTGDVDITASGGKVDINGDSAVNIVGTGRTTTIDGQNFYAHVHSGVFAGGSDTGPVV